MTVRWMLYLDELVILENYLLLFLGLALLKDFAQDVKVLLIFFLRTNNSVNPNCGETPQGEQKAQITLNDRRYSEVRN